MSEVKVIVLTGDGINCEVETANAFKSCGANVDIVHVSKLFDQASMLNDYNILAIPGGFSFGDEIRSGKLFALKIKKHLSEELNRFVADEKKLIIGICNGFQILVQLGLLPRPLKHRNLTLSQNKQAEFINRWVEMDSIESKCIWTKGINGDYLLPIRHMEGRVVFKENIEYQKLLENGQIALKYKNDVNGSYEKIAGICDPTGRIFGLMPHPEAAISKLQLPNSKYNEDQPYKGRDFFINAITHIQEQ